MERLRAEFFDIGAVVYFLRKVIWTVPDFTVERYRDGCANCMSALRPRGLSSRTPTRVLVEARKPELITLRRAARPVRAADRVGTG